jgi:hypothetical protein
LLTSAPILRIVDPNEDFMVFTDASKEVLGGVLNQNGFVICYESRKLKEHEKNYVTHDLELAAIVHALREWRHYLVGRRFKLRTEHNNMKYLFDQPTLNAKQSRWLDFLCEYDFDIKHIKGKDNKVVVTLNRRVHELHATAYWVTYLSIFSSSIDIHSIPSLSYYHSFIIPFAIHLLQLLIK